MIGYLGEVHSMGNEKRRKTNVYSQIERIGYNCWMRTQEIGKKVVSINSSQDQIHYLKLFYKEEVLTTAST